MGGTITRLAAPPLAHQAPGHSRRSSGHAGGWNSLGVLELRNSLEIFYVKFLILIWDIWLCSWYLLIFTFGHVRPHMVTWSHHLVSSCCWFDNVCFIQSDNVLNGCLRTLRRSFNLWSPTGTISRTVDLIRLQFQRMYHIHLRRTYKPNLQVCMAEEYGVQ